MPVPVDDAARRPLVAVSANAIWNIVNYRMGLVHALKAAGYEVVVIAPAGAGAEVLRGAGVRLHPIAVDPHGTSPAGDLLLLSRYLRLLRRIRPAAYLGFTAKPNIYGSIAASLAGAKVLNNVSGLGRLFVEQTLLTRFVSGLYRVALRRSDVVFFQNADDLALFRDRGLVRNDQTALLPGSGVDLDHFAPRPREHGGGPFTFLLSARLLWDKGVGEFVEAARLLRSRGLEARFQILGIVESEGRAAVPRSDLHRWHSEGLVEFLGSATDVRPAYAAADCLVLPSYYREGVPRALLEASAMAIPVITADATGSRDAVDDGVTGLLCEPRSAESLAVAMERMLRMNSGERAQMGASGRRKMELQFRQELVHMAYLSALDRLGVRPRLKGAEGQV